jgi:multidrug efflux pump subunit AcrA (membrane-fusion protein)
MSVGFKEGQIVEKGDFLAQIDQRPFEALKAQFEGQLVHDQGVLDQARLDNVRFQTLLKQDSIARQQAEDQAYIVKQDEGTAAGNSRRSHRQLNSLTIAGGRGEPIASIHSAAGRHDAADDCDSAGRHRRLPVLAGFRPAGS